MLKNICIYIAVVYQYKCRVKVINMDIKKKEKI